MDGKVLYRKCDFTLRQVAPDERAAFDAFIAQSPHGYLLQSYGWGEHKREAGWTPLRFLIEHRGLTRAAATVLRRRIPGTPWCFFYIPRGPALDFADRAAAVFFRDALRFLARRHRAVFAKLDPDVPDQAIETKRLLDRYGFIPVTIDNLISGTQPRAVWRLDLTKPLADLHADLAKDNKYFLRRAEREGIRVREGGEADLPVFFRLFEATGKRKGFYVRGLRYFEAMWRHLAPSGHLRLFIAEYQDQALAAVLVGRMGDRAWGLYQGTSDEHRNVGCSYCLIWRIITWAHDEGCVFFDFGGVPWRRSEPMEHFKSSFGGYRQELIGDYDYVFRPVVYRLWLGGFALHRRVRRAGRLVRSSLRSARARVTRTTPGQGGEGTATNNKPRPQRRPGGESDS
ncbi:MAG: lipid II:glycine glycyltransferase FemX [Bacillota bacterium]